MTKRKGKTSLAAKLAASMGLAHLELAAIIESEKQSKGAIGKDVCNDLVFGVFNFILLVDRLLNF